MHEMKLQDKYFNFILNGTKRIEIRLFDEKRKSIKLGDTIIFRNQDNLSKQFKTKVIGLLRYNNFDDLFRDFDISILADISINKEELKNVLEEFYTKEDQENYGIIGIRIEIV